MRNQLFKGSKGEDESTDIINDFQKPVLNGNGSDSLVSSITIDYGLQAMCGLYRSTACIVQSAKQVLCLGHRVNYPTLIRHHYLIKSMNQN